MNLLNRITIRSRLWGASALLLLLFLAFGLFSLYEMRKLDRITWELYEHPFQVSNAALRASIGASNMLNSLRQALLARSDSEIVEAVQDVRESQRQVFDNLDVVREKILGAEGQRLERETRELLESRIKIARQTVYLLQQGNKDEAISLTLGPGDEMTDRLEHKLLELRNYAEQGAKGFMQESAYRQQEIYWRTTLFIIVATLLAWLLAVFLIKNSLADLLGLKETMSAIIRTGRLEKSTVTGSNEVADMAQHFNGLVDRLQFQFWLKDGMGRLNRELPGDLAVDQLVAQALAFICRYVEACAGAFYIHDDPASSWELSASFALGEGAYFAPQFKTGAGIVGQVAAEGRPIFLDGIGRNEAVALSATLSEPPRSLYAVPLIYQGELCGIMEVASFDSLDLGKREFLNAAAGFLAIALADAGKKEHIQKLLQSAQEANEELTALNEELQAQSEELRAQAEELQAQTAELERQRLQVEEADRLKSEFLSNMSHELRTPLNSVLTLTQLMIDRGTGKDAAQEAEYLQVIERNGRHLLNLLNDILDLSRIESGRMQVTLTEVDPAQICARPLETVRPLAAEQGLELKVSHGDLPSMYTDEDKLQQILINLLSNAVKFTDQGEVELQVAMAGDRIQFVVRDTGIGIAPETLPYIFDKFRQADGTSTRRFDGTGLGLAICRSLAIILGGEITVVSEVGRGSTFILSLPQRCPEPQETFEVMPVPRPPASTLSLPTPVREQPLVMIVEDDPVATLQIRTVIEEQGYAVEISASGAEALAKLPQIEPDAIILDLMMPEVDGFQVLEKIRATRQIEAIPVLVLTAKELTRDDRTRLARNQAQQLLQKGSLNREELGKSVRQLLGRPEPSESPISRHSGHPILVVESNQDNLLAITAVLDEAGYNYITGADCHQTVALARQAHPAMILMDIQLPGTSEMETARQIKAEPQLTGVPIVALSAMAMRGQREEILKVGFDDYLAKPFNPQDLIAMVRLWVD